MGARGFVAYAYNQYGVVMSLKTAMEFRNNFFKMYPRLLKWHDESIEHVMQFKQIRTPLGRLRHLPLIDSPKDEIRAKAERQAINSPVQSTLNDICLHLVGLIEERYGKDEEEFSVRGSSHDALYGYVRAGDHEKWFQSVQAIVDEQHEIFKTDFDWEPRLRFPVDWEIGTRWDNLTEYKLAV
jgi:DNA polymerase I-like protein with 3'-5' exonuclease and polymerase domains